MHECMNAYTYFTTMNAKEDFVAIDLGNAEQSNAMQRQHGQQRVQASVKNEAQLILPYAFSDKLRTTST